MPDGEPVSGACAPVNSCHPERILRTIDFAEWICNLGACQVNDRPDLNFNYIDREIDCLRTSPGQLLENGTWSKRAVVLDLLLKNNADGTPILAELKIRDDEDAFYGLIQCLCAAAHLVTASQRKRLRNVYGLTSQLRNSGPYLDLYVIFFEPKVRGLWPEVLKETLALRESLMKQPTITDHIRHIEFLNAALVENRVEFSVAEQAVSKLDPNSTQ